MKFESNQIHPANQISDIITRIYRAGLTTTSGGNISIIDNEGNIWVTPSAIDKGTLKVKDIVCVKNDGTIHGIHKPSSEYPFHKAIYEMRPDIKAIIHAHPPALVAFSMVRQIPNTNITPHAKKICGKIGYADYALPGSMLLGEKIATEFNKNVMAVIMENHGTVVGGSDLHDAFIRFESMEFSARTIIGAKTIGNPVYLSDNQIEMSASKYSFDLPVQKNVTHPNDELKMRKEINYIVNRAYMQGLIISAYGTVSARWRKNDFLITPSNVGRDNLKIEDIVQIKNGESEPDKLPSREVKLHQAIYENNPDINSIIMTQAPNIMAFGVSHEKFDVRTIPESWIFLQDVLLVPFGTQFTENFARCFTKSSPAVIIQNDSIIVTGDKLLQTFDRLEVAELSAKSLLLGKHLGPLVPINKEQIEDLRRKFLE